MFNWASSVTRRCFLWVSGGLVASVQSDHRAKGSSLTASEILSRLGEAYAHCDTYCDTGSVECRFLTASGETDWVSRKPFATAFVRPNRFRFEFKSHHPRRTDWHRYIISARGEEVLTWWDIRPGVERKDSLTRAISAATGVSGASALTVPGLLMPDRVGGPVLTRLGELKRLGDQRLGGVECYRIQGRFVLNPKWLARRRQEMQELVGWAVPVEAPSPIVLWIEKDTFLLRKIEEHLRLPDVKTDEVTLYESHINRTIHQDQLRFDPPAGLL